MCANTPDRVGPRRRIQASHIRIGVVVASLAALVLAGCVAPDDDPTSALAPDPTTSEPTATHQDEAASNEEYCAALTEIVGLADALLPYSEAMAAERQAAESADDPEALAAVHAWGQAMLDQVDPTVEQWKRAKLLVDDPDVIAGIDAAIRLNEVVMRPTAEWIVASQNLDDLGTFMEALPDQIGTVMTADELEAIQTLDGYTLAVCGFTVAS